MKTQSNRCWQCRGTLVLPYFRTIKDADGNSIRVHKICEADALIAIGAKKPNIGEGFDQKGAMTGTDKGNRVRVPLKDSDEV